MDNTMIFPDVERMKEAKKDVVKRLTAYQDLFKKNRKKEDTEDAFTI